MIRLAIFFISVISAAQAFAFQGGGDRRSGMAFATRSPVIAQNGIAATGQPLATQIALDILKKGGSAVDAAIAAHAAMGLMEPMMSGVGGDMFAIVWDPKSKQLYGLNGSGHSAMGLSLDRMRELAGADGVPSRGVLAVTVPGAVDGWFALHGKFGKLPMAEILAPTISYADKGFPVSLQIADYWKSIDDSETGGPVIGEFENFRETYTLDGRLPDEGEIFRNPNLAAVYRKIAEGGRDVFYEGEIAEAIVSYMKRIGGFITKSDLAAHRSTWVEPVSINYRGYDVFELPPNGQGIVALQILNILEGYDLAGMDRFSADFAHLFVEAKKLAYEDRARLYADPDFYPLDLDHLLSKDHAASQRALIDPLHARPLTKVADMLIENGDTTYITVADGDGMMVSFIASLASAYGSWLVPDGLGFVLHNRGAAFALIDGHPNIYAPGKRPFHTIIPAFMMKDGAPYLSFGLMGGAVQPQGHAQIVINMVDFGMNVQEAGDAARIRHVGGLQPRESSDPAQSTLGIETGYPASALSELEARGHSLSVGPGEIYFGGYQAILWDAKNGVYRAASEMRKDGQAAGY